MAIFITSDGVLQGGAAELQALQTRLQAGNVRVMLHLHGGLVPQAKGIEIAQTLSGPAPDGFGFDAGWEQVYVVWRTGLIETIQENWTDLFDNDRLYRALLKRLIDFVAGKLGVPGADGRTTLTTLDLTPTEVARRLEARPEEDPFGDVDITLELHEAGGRGPVVSPESDGQISNEFQSRLRQDTEFNVAADDIAAALAVDPGDGRTLSVRGDPAPGAVAYAHLDPEIRAELLAATPPDVAGRALFTGASVLPSLLKHAGAIAVRVIRRFRAKRDHGLYCTIVEELLRELYADFVGAAIWGMMKTDAADHFKAGRFGAQLVDLLTAHPPTSLTVNGHSAGAIWAAEFLQALAQKQGAPTARVSFLAPAIRVDHFAKTLQQAGDRIETFRMFTMRDDLERKDPVCGKKLAFLYPSSLLYLISGVLEDRNAAAYPDAPLVGMARFLTQNAAWLRDPQEIADVGAIMGFLARPHSGLVLSTVSGGPGLSSQSIAHGDFDHDPDTVASVVVFAS